MTANDAAWSAYDWAITFSEIHVLAVDKSQLMNKKDPVTTELAQLDKLYSASFNELKGAWMDMLSSCYFFSKLF